MEMMNAGKSSRTDIVLCYMDNRVDHGFLEKVKKRIESIKVDALTMNQESLAECAKLRAPDSAPDQCRIEDHRLHETVLGTAQRLFYRRVLQG